MKINSRNAWCCVCFRWPRLQKLYRQNETYDWQKEYRTRHVVCQQIQRTVVSISKRFFTEVVSVDFTTALKLVAKE